MTITKNFLTAETKTGLMDIYVASPQVKAPVVIVLQEAFGVNHHIRSICDRLAEEGFLAAAPELFHREGRRIEVDYANRQDIFPLLHKLTNQGLIQDVRDTINFLDNLPLAEIREVATIGFCMGGFASALAGAELSIKKMVSFYGAGMVRPREGFELKPFVQKLATTKARSLFFFGGKDASITEEDISAIRAELKKSKTPHNVVVFENSDHGFFCDERKSYDAEAAKVAWEKTLEFLKQEPQSK